MIYLYGLILFLLSLYSYSLIDLNLTLFNFPQWDMFRSIIIQLGYFHRDYSSGIYVAFVIVLFVFHYYFLKQKRYGPVKIAGLTAVILFLSYPFLSHDFFNYMFDAKIVTQYHMNPYLKKPLDFPADDWLRFMHWTHRSYPYGPTFLPLTLIPSFLGFGKFIVTYVLFKAFFLSLYVAAVYYLSKLQKRWGMIVATSPLVLMEGLVSLHNDVVAVSLGLIGIYFLYTGKTVVARMLFIVSGGIKYLTMPLILLQKKNMQITKLVFAAILGLVVYLSFSLEIQPWYFLSLFLLLPYYETFLELLQPFFFGLLLSYYPYVRFGGWDSVDKIQMKHTIILIFFIVTVLWGLYKKWKK
jgi:hypothetical protein